MLTSVGCVRDFIFKTDLLDNISLLDAKLFVLFKLYSVSYVQHLKFKYI